MKNNNKIKDTNIISPSFIVPQFIKAGSNMLKLGQFQQPPAVDCRVISEIGYQQLKRSYDKMQEIEKIILINDIIKYGK